MKRSILVPQRLILLMGVPGAGKTSIAKRVLQCIAAVYVDNNFFADPFSRESRVDDFYRSVRGRLYEAIYRLTRENLSIGNSVLLDIPHVTHSMDEAWARMILSMIDETGSALRALKCVCSENVLKRRITQRGEARDLWKIENWSQFLKNEPIDFMPPFPSLTINTEKDISKNVAEAVKYIIAE
jgi:predicted kinase